MSKIKILEDEFAIDEDYEQRLRGKREIFRTATKTKKTIQITMITTYVVKSTNTAVSSVHLLQWMTFFAERFGDRACVMKNTV